MTYQQALDYMYNHLPMYQRIGPAAYKNNLDNTISICNLLDNPQNDFRSIHIAGTNGKGSTAHLIASILQTKGLKTGLYTSPHLKEFRERIRINGKMIPGSFVVSFISKYRTDFEKIKPSFFEMTVGMAFKYFCEEKVDIAVIEVGLGGRLDSTNIIQPLVSVITNIGLDHTQFLGDTMEKIATEKAAIIKHGVPVIIGETQAETRKIFINEAQQKKTEITFADQNLDIKNNKITGTSRHWMVMDIFREKQLYLSKLKCPLTGFYQQRNIKTTLQLVDVLNQLGFKIEKKHIRKGFYDVIKSTKLAGRWQILSNDPLTICDIAHNPDGIKLITKQIKSIYYRHLHFVLGVVNDKNLMKVLPILPEDATYYFCKANIPRGMDQKILQCESNKYNLVGSVYGSVKEAYTAAQTNAGSDDLVFIGGSTFVVAEIL